MWTKGVSTAITLTLIIRSGCGGQSGYGLYTLYQGDRYPSNSGKYRAQIPPTLVAITKVQIPKYGSKQDREQMC